MNQCDIIQLIEKKQLKTNLPKFRVGDTIAVHTRIIEGEKERVQIFTGTVIAKKGCGLSETVSLYRVSYGTGMERVFTIHSPKIAKIEITSRGDTRLAKLYYIRGALGKAAKVKKLLGKAAVIEAPAPEADA